MTQPPLTPLQKLLAGPLPSGRLVWIGLRTSRHGDILTPDTAELVPSTGIAGDRYHTRTNGGRQVTLVAEESLAAIASYLGRAEVSPHLLRRNLVTRGINLTALKGRNFRIGPVLLAYSGECAPCSQMEENLGPGGYNAVRGNGGITARIIEGGLIRIGDTVARAEEA